MFPIVLFSTSCFSNGGSFTGVFVFKVRLASFFCFYLLYGFITKKFTAHNGFVLESKVRKKTLVQLTIDQRLYMRSN